MLCCFSPFSSQLSASLFFLSPLSVMQSSITYYALRLPPSLLLPASLWSHLQVFSPASPPIHTHSPCNHHSHLQEATCTSRVSPLTFFNNPCLYFFTLPYMITEFLAVSTCMGIKMEKWKLLRSRVEPLIELRFLIYKGIQGRCSARRW